MSKLIAAFVSCFTVCCLLSPDMSFADEATAIKQIADAGGKVSRISSANDDREISFYLSSKPIGDAQLQSISHVGNVVWLNLANTKISNAGLKSIASIKSLARLHLEKTKISDDGLKHLAKLENLEYLNLYATEVTDCLLYTSPSPRDS